jgi:hypothetical protein
MPAVTAVGAAAASDPRASGGQGRIASPSTSFRSPGGAPTT